MFAPTITRWIVGLLVSGIFLLALVAVVSWRHRHVGTVAHTHHDSHSHAHSHHHQHGHTHSHNHGHSHNHHHHHGAGHSHHHAELGRAGWHVHISLFGIELTLWEPAWIDSLVVSAANRPHAGSDKDEKPASPVFRSASPVGGLWVALFWIEPAPVPARTKVPPLAETGPVFSGMAVLYAGPAEAPPVPPPRFV